MVVTMPLRRLECGRSQGGLLRSLLCLGLSWIIRQDYEGTFNVPTFGVRREDALLRDPELGPPSQTLNAERRTMNDQIDRSFFETDPLTCAHSLIGCELVWEETAGLIVETEAYAEHGDQASHTFLRRGTREFIELNPPGTLYVYLNYGVHWLLNFLVKGGQANGFVLIRALEPTNGCHLMAQRRGISQIRSFCSGPGKLTQALSIHHEFHGHDFFAISHAKLLARRRDINIEVDRRVGITKSAEFDWRFLLAGSAFVSRAKRKTRPRAN
jgi:DNA-3-methyladenine glycosylase